LYEQYIDELVKPTELKTKLRQIALDYEPDINALVELRVSQLGKLDLVVESEPTKDYLKHTWPKPSRKVRNGPKGYTP
jgi:hypothetical protein